MWDEQAAFGFRQKTLGDITVVELWGELDILAATRTAAGLDALAVRGPRPDLILDLRLVTFLDCSGMTVLCRVRNRVLERDGRVRLMISDPRMLRLLRLAGLAGAFEVLDEPAPGLLRSVL